jgi:Ser/Thr protein kinase RdoA (MazF antagonist)
MSAHFHFAQLQPDILLDALESYRILPESGLQALNSYENRVYQFKAEDQQKYVVKFYRPERWTAAQIGEEHQFCRDLQQVGLDIIAPLQFDGQSLLQYQQYFFAIFPSKGGRAFSAEQDEHWEQLGNLLGQIHQTGAGQGFRHRPQLNIEADLRQAIAELLRSPLLPVSLHDDFALVTAELLQNIRQLGLPASKSIRLHGDCHAGNILSDQRLFLLDFDDCLQGPAVQDWWMLLSGDDMEQRIQLEILAEQYQNFTDFNQSELALIEPLRCRRQIMYMLWLAKRWPDPAFPLHFPWFATEDYWRQQLAQLKLQLQRLQQPVLRLYPDYY